MQRANDIRVVIKSGRLNGGPNASARSQMNDRVHFLAAKHGSHGVVVSKIDVTNGYIFRQPGNVRVLDLRIVRIIKVVQDDDFMPSREQLLSKMRSDETGATCDQNSHGAKLPTDGKYASLWLATFAIASILKFAPL